MSDAETGPKPLSRSEILNSGGFFGTISVVNGGRFNEYGMFSVLSRDDPNREVWDLKLTEDGRLPYTGIGLLMWSSRLLDLDPETNQLRWLSKRRRFMVTDQTTGKISGGIPLTSVRTLDRNSGVREVGNSGYLLDMHPSSYDTEEKRRALDEELAGVEKGIRPSKRDNSPYVKVLEPEFIGRKVLFLRVII